MLTRALILLLLVLNLGVATWWWLRPAADTRAAATVDPLVPRLRLVGEKGVAAARPQASVARPAPACFEFGPFDDAVSFAHAQAVLQQVATRMEVRREPGGRGWRVWMPPLPDLEAARAMAARIVAAGLKDYYVVPNGAEANSIALGRYGNAAAAQRRQQTLRAAGFESLAEPLGSGPRWLRVAMGVEAPAWSPGADMMALQHPLDCAAFAPLAVAG
ncbi:MAG: hypothetical protein ACJ8GK_03750 [Luteimonas sp.]